MKIPQWCKKDCKFRDVKARKMPACQYFGKLNLIMVENKSVCLSYKKQNKKREE